MRNLLACAGALCFSATAVAGGDTDPNGQNRIAFDDGSGENLWAVQAPAGPSDWFNVDFDSALSGQYIVTVQIDAGETAGIAGDFADLAIYTEDTAIANAPDISGGRVTGRTSPSVDASDVAGTEDAYVVDAKGTLAAGDHHVAIQFRVGDSHTWCAADTNGSLAGRSYFTASNYSTGALPFSVNWMLAAGAYESTAAGTLLINGSTSTTVETSTAGGPICLTFFGPALNTASILYLCIGGNPFLQLLPASFTITDGFFAGPCPQTWQICAGLTCNTPTAAGIELCTLYFDSTDLKANGKPKIKIGASATLNITQGADCAPPGGAGDCFGQRDDCVLDSTIWKVQNPAGPSDWFNMHAGSTSGSSTTVNNLTGVSVSSWDFCGFGPCWNAVGIYAANTAVDATGCTPDVANPITSVGGASACMAPAAGDWGCPLTFYDTADVTASSTTDYHAAVQWQPNDSCSWLGSDTDGVDSSCGTPIPSNGCTSLFTTNSYTSPAVTFTAANWMIQIDWN